MENKNKKTERLYHKRLEGRTYDIADEKQSYKSEKRRLV